MPVEMPAVETKSRTAPRCCIRPRAEVSTGRFRGGSEFCLCVGAVVSRTTGLAAASHAQSGREGVVGGVRARGCLRLAYDASAPGGGDRDVAADLLFGCGTVGVQVAARDYDADDFAHLDVGERRA